MELTKELVDLLKERHKKEEERPKYIDEAKKDENIVNWCSVYRRNVNIYASQRLQIAIHPFQHIMLYLMGVSQVFFAICSRGLSKNKV